MTKYGDEINLMVKKDYNQLCVDIEVYEFWLKKLKALKSFMKIF